MLGQRKTIKAKMAKELGFILYEGPSALDGAPIVVIATLETSNAKTGNMIQTWIIRSDINPLEASALALDVAICGHCPHRRATGGACYVNLAHAPQGIFKAYQRGRYPVFNLEDHAQYFVGRKIRLGAYGDPAAAPFSAWQHALDLTSGHTGYTHQINHKGFDRRYLKVCMVSADSPRQALKFQAQGAKTFRVAMASDDLFASEIECRADSDGIQCIDCGLCDGARQNIAIAVHGSLASRFKTSLIASTTIGI
jgi:hypothetical protein